MDFFRLKLGLLQGTLQYQLHKWKKSITEW